ncbi:AbiJ-NTD4 domain-containing protein [Hymenobacter ruber]
MAAKFSERIGKREPKMAIQTDTMDIELKNGIWNMINMHIISDVRKEFYLKDSKFSLFFHGLYFSFFKEPVDTMNKFGESNADLFRRRFFSWDALDVYDFLDFAASSPLYPGNKEDFIKGINHILERELSGYRFINGELAPITNETEIKSIEQAISNTREANYKGASIHLSAALDMLSDRQTPDYRNSIKESISAVESVCQVIAGTSNATLGSALKVIEKTIPIHGALKQGLLSIYGYTSDGDGIRHALLEETSLNQEDALFMLVTCSAFVNYLTVKAAKITPTT